MFSRLSFVLLVAGCLLLAGLANLTLQRLNAAERRIAEHAHDRLPPPPNYHSKSAVDPVDLVGHTDPDGVLPHNKSDTDHPEMTRCTLGSALDEDSIRLYVRTPNTLFGPYNVPSPCIIGSGGHCELQIPGLAEQHCVLRRVSTSLIQVASLTSAHATDDDQAADTAQDGEAECGHLALVRLLRTDTVVIAGLRADAPPFLGVGSAWALTNEMTLEILG
jgi:hypothetical protein